MSEMTAEEHRAAIAEEYGSWVANQDIDINGVRAFNKGDAVPKGHIESGVVGKDYVVGTKTKAAAAAKES